MGSVLLSVVRNIMEDCNLIYKYRTWTNEFHRNALIHNQIYFASPKELNDPFDFKIYVDYKKLDTELKREKYVDKLIRDGFFTLVKNNIHPTERKRLLMLRLFIDRDNMQDEFDEHNNIWTENRFGVASFSTKWNNILMWSHYSQNHTGFCLGYNKKKLEELKKYGTAGIVHYDDNYPSIDPLIEQNIQDILAQSHTKAADWTYESEYRLTKLWEKSNPTVTDRLCSIPRDFIEEIILGLSISKSHQSTILKIARQKGIKVFKIKKVRHTFKLDRSEL